MRLIVQVRVLNAQETLCDLPQSHATNEVQIRTNAPIFWFRSDNLSPAKKKYPGPVLTNHDYWYFVKLLGSQKLLE